MAQANAHIIQYPDRPELITDNLMKLVELTPDPYVHDHSDCGSDVSTELFVSDVTGSSRERSSPTYTNS